MRKHTRQEVRKDAGQDVRDDDARQNVPDDARQNVPDDARQNVPDDARQNALENGRTGTDPAAAGDAGAHCRNCGAGLTGPFCARCGQSSDTRIPTIWNLLGEWLDSVYSLDSRVWRTLLPLAVRPGVLTVEYMAGRRQRYVAPLRLYLVLSLGFFVVETLVDTVSAGTASGEQVVVVMPADECRIDVGFIAPGSPLHDRLTEACRRVAADSGRSLGAAFADRLPLMMFLLIPLAAAMLYLLHATSRRRYIEHLTFLLHVHAFMFLAGLIAQLIVLLSALTPLPALFGTATQIMLWVFVPFYAFRAMRRVYGQGRFVTVIKYMALFFAYAASLVITFTAGLLFSALSLE